MFVARSHRLSFGLAMLLALSLGWLGIQSVSAQPLRDDAAAPKRIEVSLSTQQMIAWEGDRKVYAFPVTTGQDGQPTIPGEFAILDKDVSAFSEGWQLNMPFWMGIYQFGDYENGIHALPTDSDGVEYWRDALGQYPATHGCIVLAPQDAETLFNWVDIGTPVDVHD